MTTIEFMTGDATKPVGDGPKIIVHICNDIGGWGKGFVLAISKRWQEPEAAYRGWHKTAAICPSTAGRSAVGASTYRQTVPSKRAIPNVTGEWVVFAA